MNSAPHLLPEDRPEFERILSEALRTARSRSGQAAGQRPNTEQLRTRALAATAAISSCAAAEYQRYVQVRAERRTPSRAGGPTGLAGVAEASGAGVAAVLSVLVPLLAGTAAVIFLPAGYLLRLFSPERPIADSMISVGWVFAGLAALGVLVAMGALLLTALRNSGSSARDGEDDPDGEIAHAREAWRRALLERGVLPFLSEALTAVEQPAVEQPRADRTADRPGSRPAGPMPHLGYSRPGFTSPASEEDGPRHRLSFSSPDYTSPEYKGPDHHPE